jgi:hypothetical protein
MQASAVLIFATLYAKLFGGMKSKGIYFSQPYVFLVLINLIYDCIHQSQYEVNKIKSVGFYALRLSFSCLAINFFLKLDMLVDGKWRELFWPAWLFFALCIGLSFITLSLLATRLCMKMEGKAVDPNEITGLGFISLNILGMIVTIVMVWNYSEATIKTGQLSRGMAGCFWFVFGYNTCLLGYFVWSFHKLVEVLYLQRSARSGGRRSHRDASAPRAVRNQIHTQFFLERLHPAVVAQSRLDLFKRKRPVAVLDHPKFLIRMASSLFKVAPDPPVASLTAHKKSSILRRDPRTNNASAKKLDIKAGSVVEQQQANTAPRSHKKTVSEYLQVRNNQPSRSSENLSQSVVIDSDNGEIHRNALAMMERRLAAEQPEANKENQNNSNVSKTQQHQHQTLQPDLAQSHHSR